MTPPITPGIPGQRLPEPWEAPLAALTRRVEQLEKDAGITREQLHSYTGEEEDSKVTIPSDAPPKAKVALGALAGLTPTGRAVVIVILGLATIAAATLLILRGVKLF